MQSIRTWHTYIGTLIAPSVLFFALTGALQLFSLHEAHDSYAPPPLVEKLASVHKDQGPPREAKAKPAGETPKPPMPKPAGDAAAKRPNPLPLKIFVVLMAIGLLLSTITGLTVALANPRTRRTYLAILIAGAVVPCVLLWL